MTRGMANSSFAPIAIEAVCRPARFGPSHRLVFMPLEHASLVVTPQRPDKPLPGGSVRRKAVLQRNDDRAMQHSTINGGTGDVAARLTPISAHETQAWCGSPTDGPTTASSKSLTVATAVVSVEFSACAKFGTNRQITPHVGCG